jgi:hypothetical protein
MHRLTGNTPPAGHPAHGAALADDSQDMPVILGAKPGVSLHDGIRSAYWSANTAAVHATGRIVQTSASTGRSRRVLNVLSRVPYHGGWSCYPESPGPSQVHVLVWCLNRFGRLDGSHFTPLPGPSKDLGVILGAAW